MIIRHYDAEFIIIIIIMMMMHHPSHKSSE